jgi:predicted esterase
MQTNLPDYNFEMKRNMFFSLMVLSLLASCLTNKKITNSQTYGFSLDTLTFTDNLRNRNIPIALYKPSIDNPKIVIFSHGYGQNKGGDYLAYSYLTEFLASKGFFVISIQHELPTDNLLPLTGNPQTVRRPFWERGADNILFVINEIKKTFPELNYGEITLIGHSNGGDMTVLFPQKYPNIVEKIVSLDNRRMALPRTKKPKIYSLRSSDQTADESVLPTEDEIKKFGIKIIKLHNTKHDEMDDNANTEQRKEIQNYLLKFLNE